MVGSAWSLIELVFMSVIYIYIYIYNIHLIASWWFQLCRWVIVVGKMWGPLMIHCYIVLAVPNLCIVASWCFQACWSFLRFGEDDLWRFVELKPPTIVVVSWKSYSEHVSSKIRLMKRPLSQILGFSAIPVLGGSLKTRFTATNPILARKAACNCKLNSTMYIIYNIKIKCHDSFNLSRVDGKNPAPPGMYRAL